MKTFQNDLHQIESYVSGNLNPGNTLLFEARLLIDPVLKLHVELHKRIHSLIRMYGRKKIKKELGIIHQRLFNDPERIAFQQNIYKLFSNE